jgi:hypothetical protein
MLAAVHRILMPRNYFEIGSRSGNSLKYATVPAIAVDPAFQLPDGFVEARPLLRLFQMTSDDFFARHDVQTLLGEPIDFAFLDGMHCFEFLLRDFMNVEKSASPRTVIALHDCVPFSSAIVSRDQKSRKHYEYDVMPGAWAGDVWKLLPILRKYRPDLHITVFDCPPTGLTFVSSLNPCSSVLHDAYDTILAENMDRTIEEIGVSEFAASQGVISSQRSLTAGDAALLGLIAPHRG